MISVCIITKNEEKMLEKCLAAISGYGFEIIVVDTGSTDGTKEMALKYTDKIYDFVWCDDFSAARNFSISKATNEYILVLDSDEFVEKIDVEGLKNLAKKYPDYAGRIKRINEYETAGSNVRNRERITRFFPKSKYYYTGIIHEQVTPKDNREGVCVFDAPVEIFHAGYSGTEEERKKKAMRNAALLEIEYNKNPNDLYIIYQLGKSYYMYGDYERASYYFSKALEMDINVKLGYGADAIITYGYSMINAGKSKEALKLERFYEKLCHISDYLFVMALICMNNQLFDVAIDLFLEATKIGDEHTYTEGTNSYLAYYNAGVICECLGRKEEAVKLYKMCGSYEKATRQLNNL